MLGSCSAAPRGGTAPGRRAQGADPRHLGLGEDVALRSARSSAATPLPRPRDRHPGHGTGQEDGAYKVAMPLAVNRRGGAGEALGVTRDASGAGGYRFHLDLERVAREAGDDHQRRGRRRHRDAPVAHRHIGGKMLARRDIGVEPDNIGEASPASPRIDAIASKISSLCASALSGIVASAAMPSWPEQKTSRAPAAPRRHGCSGRRADGAKRE